MTLISVDLIGQQIRVSLCIFSNHVPLSIYFVSNNSYGAVNIPNSTHEFLPRFIIFNRIKTNSCGYLALIFCVLILLFEMFQYFTILYGPYIIYII